MSLSLIRGACLVSDVVLMNPFVGVSGITSVATIVGLFAGDKNLWGDINIWPFGFSKDFDSVAEGGCGREGPAGATVLGDMLISLVGEVVGAIDIAPPEIIWEIIDGGDREGIFDTRLEGGAVDMPSVLGNIERDGE